MADQGLYWDAGFFITFSLQINFLEVSRTQVNNYSNLAVMQ